MVKFVVGETYEGVIKRTGSVRLFEVVKRTPKFITIRGEMVPGTEKIRVQEVDGVETAKYDCAWLHYTIEANKSLNIIPEEDKPMKKATINDAVAAVAVADTVEAIQEVLEQCTKPQLHEVFLAATGLETERAPKSWNKDMIVSYYAKEIVAYKAREGFKTMTAEEKAEYIKGCNPLRDNNRFDDLLRLCSLYELLVINARFGGTYDEYKEICEKYYFMNLVRVLKESIHTRMSWIRMIANSQERKAQSEISQQVETRAESDSTFKEAALSYLKEHVEVEVSEAEGDENMKKDALAYVQEHAELEERLSRETQTENEAETENLYLKAEKTVKNTIFTTEQCRVISDIKARIKVKVRKDGCYEMTVSQYIWRELESKGYKGIINWKEAYKGVRDFLSIFGVPGIEALDTMECLSLIDCVSYCIGEQIYNSIQQADTETEISPVEDGAATDSQIEESKPKTKRSKPITFEVGKTYTATDRENEANMLTFTVLDRYEVYCGANFMRDGYDLSDAEKCIPNKGKKREKFSRLIIHMTGTRQGKGYDYTGASEAICIINEDGQKIEYMSTGGLCCVAEWTPRDRLIGSTLPIRYVWYADRPDAPKLENQPVHIKEATKTRKGMQKRLHELWLLRREIRQAQCSSEISLADYEALGEQWERCEAEVKELLNNYQPKKKTDTIERRKIA